MPRMIIITQNSLAQLSLLPWTKTKKGRNRMSSRDAVRVEFD